MVKKIEEQLATKQLSRGQEKSFENSKAPTTSTTREEGMATGSHGQEAASVHRSVLEGLRIRNLFI